MKTVVIQQSAHTVVVQRRPATNNVCGANDLPNTKVQQHNSITLVKPGLRQLCTFSVHHILTFSVRYTTAGALVCHSVLKRMVHATLRMLHNKAAALFQLCQTIACIPAPAAAAQQPQTVTAAHVFRHIPTHSLAPKPPVFS